MIIVPLVLAGFCWPLPMHAHSEVGLPEKARQNLEGWASKASPLFVEWKIKKNSNLPPDQMFERLKMTPTPFFFQSIQASFATQGGRFLSIQPIAKVTMQKKDAGTKEKVVQSMADLEVSFDGSIVYNGTKGKDSVLIINPLAKAIAEHPDDPVARQPEYLRLIGYEIPDCYAELKTNPMVRSAVVRLASENENRVNISPATIRGKEVVCVRILNSHLDKAWFLDPNRSHLPVGWEEYSASGKVAARAVFEEFETLPRSKLILPRLVHVTHYGISEVADQAASEVLFHTEVAVVKFSDETLPPETFVLDYKMPGAIVGNSALPEAKEKPSGQIVYIVPANPADLEEAIEKASKSVVGNNWRHGPRIALLVVSAGLLLMVVAYLWRRRRLRQNSAEKGTR